MYSGPYSFFHNLALLNPNIVNYMYYLPHVQDRSFA